MTNDTRMFKPSILEAKREMTEEGIEVLRLVAPVMGEAALKRYDQIVDDKVKTQALDIEGKVKKQFDNVYDAFDNVDQQIQDLEEKVKDTGALDSAISQLRTEVTAAFDSVDSDISSARQEAKDDNEALSNTITAAYKEADSNIRKETALNLETSIDFVKKLHETDINEVNGKVDSTKNELSSTIEANKTVLETKLNAAVADLISKIDGLPTSTDLGNAIASAMRSVYKYRGSVPNEMALPVGLGETEAGWVFNLEDTGMNVAWDGEKWDSLGQAALEVITLPYEEFHSILDGGELNFDSKDFLITAEAYKALFDKVKTFVSGDVADLINDYTEADNKVRSDLTAAYKNADASLKASLESNIATIQTNLLMNMGTLQAAIDAEASKSVADNESLYSQIQQELNTFADQMSSALNNFVEKTTTINNIPLNDNVTLTPEDIGAVPTSRTINGMPLTEDIVIPTGGGEVVGDYLPLEGGSLSGSLDMSGNKVTNVGDPTADGDAANKKYVDDAISSVPSGGGGGGVDFTIDDTLTMSSSRVLGVKSPVNNILSQEEFDALSEEEKKKGLYIIKTPSAIAKKPRTLSDIFDDVVEAGYTGTREEFVEMLAGGPWLPLDGSKPMEGVLKLNLHALKFADDVILKYTQGFTTSSLIIPDSFDFFRNTSNGGERIAITIGEPDELNRALTLDLGHYAATRGYVDKQFAKALPVDFQQIEANNLTDSPVKFLPAPILNEETGDMIGWDASFVNESSDQTPLPIMVSDLDTDTIGYAVPKEVVQQMIEDAVSEGGSGGGESLPKGVIIAYHGTVDKIPSGWALCDGTKGTPDLRDKFIVGAGRGYTEGATGGEATHALTVNEMPKHSHGLPDNRTTPTGSDFLRVVKWDSTQMTTLQYGQILPNTQEIGGGSAHNNLPPYYALFFIMKISDSAGSGVASANNFNNVYSEEETVISTWIDGKPLYRKTVKIRQYSSITAGGDFVVSKFRETHINDIGILVNVEPIMYQLRTEDFSNGLLYNMDCINPFGKIFKYARVADTLTLHSNIAVAAELSSNPSSTNTYQYRYLYLTCDYTKSTDY